MTVSMPSSEAEAWSISSYDVLAIDMSSLRTWTRHQDLEAIIIRSLESIPS
jgi:hypothetical protein